MKHKLFTVFDEKARAYLPLFMMHREEMAMRTFGDCVNDPNHAFGRHPADYTLFEIGEFDDVKGVVEPAKTARLLGNGVTFHRPAKNVEDDMMSIFGDTVIDAKRKEQ